MIVYKLEYSKMPRIIFQPSVLNLVFINREVKNITQTQIEQEIAAFWQSQHIFEQSVSAREGKTPYVFYEGPPSANGLPGIHHVLARSLKDIFCRFKTLQGFQVKEKAAGIHMACRLSCR